MTNAVPTAAEDLIAKGWRTWAAKEGLDPDRPTKNDLQKFYSERSAVLASFGDGPLWLLFLEALARHGYQAVDTAESPTTRRVERGNGSED